MKQPPLASLTPFSRLLFSIILILSCFLAVFLPAMLLAGPLFGVDLFNAVTVVDDFSDPANMAYLKYMQITQSFGLFIFPPLLAGFFFGGNPLRYHGLDRLSNHWNYLLTLMIMISALPFINWMISVNELMQLPAFLQGLETWMKTAEQDAARITEAFLNVDSGDGLLLNLFMIAALPAVGEELLFRGLFQRLFGDMFKNIHISIWITAILFGAMHLQFYGFLPRMMLGVLFGYLYLWTGSLWVPIWAHFINNGAAVTVSWLVNRGALTGSYEDFGATDNIFLIAGSVILVAGLCYLIYKQKQGVNKTRASL
jgi:membrane protease YdiL (CAAX protease family)